MLFKHPPPYSTTQDYRNEANQNCKFPAFVLFSIPIIITSRGDDMATKMMKTAVMDMTKNSKCGGSDDD